MSAATDHPPALTALTEDEEDFRAAVREFAESTIRPKIQEMDAAQQMDREIIDACVRERAAA